MVRGDTFHGGVRRPGAPPAAPAFPPPVSHSRSRKAAPGALLVQSEPLDPHFLVHRELLVHPLLLHRPPRLLHFQELGYQRGADSDDIRDALLLHFLPRPGQHASPMDPHNVRVGHFTHPRRSRHGALNVVSHRLHGGPHNRGVQLLPIRGPLHGVGVRLRLLRDLLRRILPDVSPSQHAKGGPRGARDAVQDGVRGGAALHCIPGCCREPRHGDGCALPPRLCAYRARAGVPHGYRAAVQA
mmetsp:Transcript_34595/g.81962  ORF Transcript_34595/g.81962 Transcript_34595/m.81962 type:complete len:242 (-) Transcript_34595:38-763(-)